MTDNITQLPATAHTLAQVPEELQQRRQWVPFKRASNGKKVPVAGYRADCADNWLTFEQALALCKTPDSMVAFALTVEDPYTVIDLDAPKDPNTPDEVVQLILQDHARLREHLNFTYCEESVSGKGHHIWLKGSIDGTGLKNSKACVEIYDCNRFIICTGVSNNQPIVESQEAVTALVEKFRGRKLNHATEFLDQPLQYTDDELLDIAAKRFPNRFENLFTTPTDPNSDHKSEDDHALIAMLTELSGNLEQIHRLFFQSKRVRHKHVIHPDNYITRVAIKCQKAITMQSIQTFVQVQTAPQHAAKPQVQTPDDDEEEPPTIFDSHYPTPGGLLRELMDYCMAQAPHPDSDVALAGAVTTLAAFVGRRYLCKGATLNVYTALLAPSAHGKSMAAQLCNDVATSLEKPIGENRLPQACVPGVGGFARTNIRSAPALYKNVLPEQQSFAWLIDELGRVESVRNSKYNTTGSELQAALLELYNTTSAGGHTVSDKGENTQQVLYPAVTVLGNSVESNYFNSLDEDFFHGGMFGRYFFIVIRRPRARGNPRKSDMPAELREKMVTVAGQGKAACGPNMSNMTENCLQLQFSVEAEEYFDRYDEYANQHYNHQLHAGGTDPVGILWGRAMLKILKLAGLHAVSRIAGQGAGLLDTHLPTVEVEDLVWAVKFTEHERAVLREIAANGGLGDAAQGGLSVREQSLLAAMRDLYIRKSPKHWNKKLYRVGEPAYRNHNGAASRSALHCIAERRAGWSPKQYREDGFRSFKDALDAAINTLVSGGYLLSKKEGHGEYFWLADDESVSPQVDVSGEDGQDTQTLVLG